MVWFEASGSPLSASAAAALWALEAMTRSPDPARALSSPRHQPRRLPGTFTPLLRQRGWLLAFAVALIVLAACSRISNPEGWSGGLVTDDTLYIGTRDGELVALQRSSGQTIWTFALKTEDEADRAIYGTPVLAGGTIFLGGYDGVLYALDRDGFEKWREPIGSPDQGRLDRPIVGGPVVAGDIVLIGSSDGKKFSVPGVPPPCRLTVQLSTSSLAVRGSFLANVKPDPSAPTGQRPASL